MDDMREFRQMRDFSAFRSGEKKIKAHAKTRRRKGSQRGYFCNSCLFFYLKNDTPFNFTVLSSEKN